MTYALDANVISYILKDDELVTERYRQECKNGNEFIIPPIAFYEVQRGLLAKGLIARKRIFDAFCKEVPVGRFNYHILLKAAEIYATLKQLGKSIGDGDIFIAAFCLTYDFVLVTNNIRHFSFVKDLKIINWK